MEIGNIVEPISHEFTLALGCDRYPKAVVVNLTPFQLMSLEGDMFWGCTMTENQHGFKVVDSTETFSQSVIDGLQRRGLL